MKDVSLQRCEVKITRLAEKQLKKLPVHIKEHVRSWAFAVENMGIREVRKFSGFHDEPLQGDRKGQRSVRLNKAYRLIYDESYDGGLIVVAVMEINKHDY